MKLPSRSVALAGLEAGPLEWLLHMPSVVLALAVLVALATVADPSYAADARPVIVLYTLAKTEKLAAQQLALYCSKSRELGAEQALLLVKPSEPTALPIIALREAVDRIPVESSAGKSKAIEMLTSLEKDLNDPANSIFESCSSEPAQHWLEAGAKVGFEVVGNTTPSRVGRVDLRRDAYELVTSFAVELGATAEVRVRTSAASGLRLQGRGGDTRHFDSQSSSCARGALRSELAGASNPAASTVAAHERFFCRIPPGRYELSSSTTGCNVQPVELLETRDEPLTLDLVCEPPPASARWYVPLRGAVPGALLAAASWVPYAIGDLELHRRRSACTNAPERCDVEEGSRAVRFWDTLHQVTLFSGLGLAGLGGALCSADVICLWRAEWWFGAPERTPVLLGVAVTPGALLFSGRY